MAAGGFVLRVSGLRVDHHCFRLPSLGSRSHGGSWGCVVRISGFGIRDSSLRFRDSGVTTPCFRARPLHPRIPTSFNVGSTNQFQCSIFGVRVSGFGLQGPISGLRVSNLGIGLLGMTSGFPSEAGRRGQDHGGDALGLDSAHHREREF